MKTKTVTEMSYHELDNLVHEHYPSRSNFESCAEFEWSNDSSHTANNIGVPKTYGTDTQRAEWDAAEIKEFKEWVAGTSKHCPGLHDVLCGLCRDGHIPPGNYLIDVSW